MTSATCGSLAPNVRRRGQPAVNLDCRTRGSGLCHNRRPPLVLRHLSPQRSAWKSKSLPCRGIRNDSRRQKAGLPAAARSRCFQNLQQHWSAGSTHLSMDTIIPESSKWCVLKPLPNRSTNRRQSRTEPGKPAQRRSAQDVRWNVS